MPKQSNIKPTNSVQWLLQSIVGGFIARSWLEKPILYVMQHWFFPLSRLWAAAVAAEGDVDKFFRAVPMRNLQKQRVKIKKILTALELIRSQNLLAEQAWNQGFFSNNSLSPAELKELEDRRLRVRNKFNKTRRNFFFLRKHVDSSVLERFPTPDDMSNLFGCMDNNDVDLFKLAEKFPQVSVSQKVTRQHSNDYWLRFDSPSPRMGDTVYARVLEPIGVSNPPTLIFGHGIGVEFDLWRNQADIMKYLPRMGIRVVRPEAPWHGRRVPSGFYGGEYFLSTTPLGSFDFFVAQHQEWAVLMDWARNTSNGKVAIGGSSLGAQAAQNTAIRANDWPERLQPDALFLMTHCSHLWEVAMDGDLADIWNLHSPLKKAGWTRKLTEYWVQQLDAKGDPCMSADRIVSVLGRTDNVTPFRSGRRLQKIWELPTENCFNWPCGHFEVPLRMLRQQNPLFRLRDILTA